MADCLDGAVLPLDTAEPPLVTTTESIHVVRDGQPSVSPQSHAARFYEDDDHLCKTVGEVVGAGLGAGDPVLVILTAAHRAGLERHLEARSFDVARAVATGALTILDTDATLAEILSDDEPSWPLFKSHVGGVVREVRARNAERPLRAYGEMVDVLWKRRNARAAIRLEEMWNELAKTENVSVTFAYALEHFDGQDEAKRVDSVSGAPSHVQPTDIGLLEQRAKTLAAEIHRREELEKELRRREEELRDFIENGVEGIHWVGPDGIILFANNAELELLGYSREEYVGRHIREFHADEGVIGDILMRLCSGETLRDYEARLRCKDGSVRNVLIHSNVFWRDGEFVHTRCFTRDITDRKRAEEALVDAKQKLEAIARELEDANRTKDDFLATVSHELRTPLNAILGWVRMLRAGGLGAEKTERALETIERNANAQTQLIDDLLDVSRIISGKLRLDVGAVDLPMVVENAIEAIRPAAQAKGITVRHTIDPDAGPILGDAERLQQVAWNLLTNAVKFTPRGGTVTVAVHKRDSAIDIVVADNGQGIAPEFLPRVFERFRQADETIARNQGGLGLGLAIVRHLVELHGGKVTVTSDGIGRGATFTVAVPISPLRATSLERPPALQMATAPAFDGALELGGIRVLVVDDEPDARELLSEMLSSCNAHVETASCPAEAIAAVEKFRPDVLVSDIGMPGEDGYSLIRKLRALPEARGGRTPAVALTAYSRFEDRTRALVSGFNMHVPKPVEPAELLAVLTSLTRTFAPRAK